MYNGVRESYSGAYQPMAGDFEESLDYGDIYGRLDALLNLTNQSGYHVQYTEDGKMEFRVWDLSVDLQNASFASADSAGNRLIADCEIELEVPVSFGGTLLPPMRMTVKVSAGYTPRFRPSHQKSLFCNRCNYRLPHSFVVGFELTRGIRCRKMIPSVSISRYTKLAE